MFAILYEDSKIIIFTKNKNQNMMDIVNLVIMENIS